MKRFDGAPVSVGTARLPPSRRCYAIGDIHGRWDLLQGALSRIEADSVAGRPAWVELVFLGDYIDRGPYSAAVVGTLIELSDRYAVVFLKGNHEACLLHFLAEPGSLREWIGIGALPTLMSYGLRPPRHPGPSDAIRLADQLRASLPLMHRLFYASLRACHVVGDFMFVHAGIDPARPVHDQDEHDLLWIRQTFLDSTALHAKVVVHGHTPVLQPDCRPNRINIDTGAFATGRLTVLRIEGADVTFL